MGLWFDEQFTQEFIEEMVARLKAAQPIILNKPVKFLNGTNGPIIGIYNTDPPPEPKQETWRDRPPLL